MAEECREKGNQCMKEEKYIEAMFHYTHGIKQDPYNAYLYSNRSLAFLRIQQYYYALEDAKTTIQLRPKWTKGYYRKGEIECAAEHYKDAVESFKQGLEKKPDETSLKEAVAKATRLHQMQCQSDSRLLWYGVAMGALVGIILVVVDEAVAKQPLLQNDVLRGLVLVSLCLVCYGIALLYRKFLTSQRSSLLDKPPDLLAGDDVLSGIQPTATSNNHPSSVSSSSSTTSSSAQQQQPVVVDGETRSVPKSSSSLSRHRKKH